MKFISLLVIAAVSIIVEGSTTEADVFGTYDTIVKKLIKKCVKEPCMKLQNECTDVAALVIASAEGSRDRFQDIWISACKDHSDSTSLKFCKVLKSMKDFSKIGAEKLIRLLDADSSSNITEKACDNYLELIENYARTKAVEYKDRVNLQNTGCYMMEFYKAVNKYQGDVENTLADLKNESLAAYTSQIKKYQNDLDKISISFQKEYESCLVRSSEVVKCLTTYSKRHEVQKLPADYKELIIQILRSIRIQFTMVGPSREQFDSVIEEHKDEAEEVLKTCSKPARRFTA